MSLVTIHNLSMAFGGPLILDKISVNIEEGERACVTGRNGEGKSTLLKIIAGIIEPDSGEIIKAPNLHIEYLSQEVPAPREGTALDVASSYRAEGVYQVNGFLDQLGVDADAEFNSLSGGLRRRVLLAGALSANPGLLLLDEPTNHLDIASIKWLESWLARAKIACIFVTHDRAFLRNVARRVFDLDRGHLSGWDCDYNTFLKRKADLIAEEERLWERKKKRLEAEESWLVHGVTARRARNMGRVAGLMALRKELSERRVQLGRSTAEISSAKESGELVAKLDGVSFQYAEGTKRIVNDLSAIILRGDRIGIIGNNGAGKTTLLRLLLGELNPTKGSIRLGSRLEPTFFDQLRATLDPEKSVGDNLSDGNLEIEVDGRRRHINGYLEEFLFTPDRVRTPVKALSGGERARLLLARMFLNPGNLLVMDEPTNDLDVETLELLEDRLATYKGTIVLVSHDREFLDGVVTSSLVLLGDGRVHFCPGGFSDWEREAPLVLRKNESENTSTKSAPSEVRQTKIERKKLGFNEKRELQALPQQIAALESEIAAIENRLADGTYFVRDHQGATADTQSLDKAREELEIKIERWMALEELQTTK